MDYMISFLVYFQNGGYETLCGRIRIGIRIRIRRGRPGGAGNTRGCDTDGADELDARIQEILHDEVATLFRA